jgi:integrase
LNGLTARSISDFRDRIRSNGLSIPTTRKVLNRLAVILDFAISRDLIAVNAARGVKVIGRRDEGSKKILPPAKAAVRRLIDIADADFSIKLAFASATGVRASELHALRWRHLDIGASRLKIETRVDVYGDEDVPKTEAGARSIPLGRAIVQMLKEWKVRSRFTKNDDLIFPNSRGGYASHQNMINRCFNPLFERLAELHRTNPDSYAPAPMRFNWHALRHFAVSTWIEAGFSPKTIQTFAGHSSLQLTYDTYGHLFPAEDHAKIMDQIANELFLPSHAL